MNSRAGLLLVAVGGLVVGLAAPAAARETSTLINGNSIAIQSVPGNRLEVNSVTGRQVKESTLAIVPRAKTALSANTATTAKTAVTATALPPLVWHKVTLLHGWLNLTGKLPAVSYAVDAEGFVHLRGSIYDNAPTSSELFDLPASMAPPAAVYVPVVEFNGVPGSLVIGPDGSVAKDDSSSTPFISLDGASWDKVG